LWRKLKKKCRNFVELLLKTRLKEIKTFLMNILRKLRFEEKEGKKRIELW
jgi:hypothetical protein